MCNCIDEFNKRIRKNTGDAVAGVTLSFGMAYCYPRIELTYRRKKQDGTLSKRISTGILVPGFCPMCGKKYE